jgi:hypothetical protein
MRPVVVRKGLIVISSGIDTFSKATYEDVLAAAAQCNVPIYTISLGPIMREIADLHGMTAPLRNDWEGAENKLIEISKASGGRLYSPRSTIDLSAIYDDIMENLRVRYVITYKPTNKESPSKPHTVRVELLNPKAGKPLQIVDANGKTIHADVTIEASYKTDQAPRN